MSTYYATFRLCTADSDAIQIGILIAKILKIPAASYIQEIRPLQQPFLWIKQKLRNCSRKLKIVMPCLLCVLPEHEQHFYMNLEGITKAYSMQIPIVDADAILKQKGKVLSVPADEAVSAIIELIVKSQILDKVKELPDSFTYIENQIELLEEDMHTEASADITQARIIVAGGRGIGNAEGFQNLRHIANLLGGEVACSRACVESGWMDAAFQVGQSGKTVCPDLYLACGISGAFQHIIGMSDSKLIISINKNPAAPIFDISDLGIVGSVEIILPRLIEALDKCHNISIK